MFHPENVFLTGLSVSICLSIHIFLSQIKRITAFQKEIQVTQLTKQMLFIK